jgi:hypothetical protein
MRLCIWMLNVHLHASPSLGFGVLEEIQVLVSHSQILKQNPLYDLLGAVNIQSIRANP